MTDDDYQRWLRDASAPRVVLIDMQHADGLVRVSNRAYITHADDSPPHTPYLDVLASALDIQSRLDAQPQWGDLELIDDGMLSDWRNYHWRGYPVTFRLGGPDWPLSDFRVIARQLSGGLMSADRGSITIGLYDQSQQLDTEIERPALPNSGDPVPLILGRVFCAPATRVDAQTLRYRVSWLPVTSLTVRDGNGPIMSHSAAYSSGEFVLSAYTPRTPVVEVREPHDTAASIVQWVAQQYGMSADVAGLPGYTLGLRYEGSGVTGRQILDDVCTAIGGHWGISLDGAIQVRVLTEPTSAALTLNEDDIEQNTLRLSSVEEPWRATVLRYGRNYTPLTEIAGSINDSDPALAVRLHGEWLNASADHDDASDYPLSTKRTIDTALVTESDAVSEAARRQSLHSPRREIYTLTAFLPPLGIEPGVAVAIDSGDLAGRVGRVISTSASPTAGRTELEVWY